MRAELNATLYSSTDRTTQPAEVTASTLAAAAALRLAAIDLASFHMLSLIMRPDWRSTRYKMQRQASVSASHGTAVSPEYLDCIVNP